MALAFDNSAAPTQGLDAAVDSTGITTSALPSDRQHGVLACSEPVYWRPGVHTGSDTAWQYLPAGVWTLHQLNALVDSSGDAVETIGIKAVSTTAIVSLRVLSPMASAPGRR